MRSLKLEAVNIINSAMMDLKSKNNNLSQRKQLCLLVLRYYSDISNVNIITDLTRFTHEYFQYIQKLILCKGKSFTVKVYVKSSRLGVFRYLSGDPINGLPFVKISKGGCPKLFNEIINKYLFNYDALKYIITLLCIFRDYKSQPILDRSPIETPWKGSIPSIDKDTFNDILNLIGVLKRRVIKLKEQNIMYRFYEPAQRPESSEWQQYHLSNKMGPNGPSLIMAITDFNTLPDKTKVQIRTLGGKLLSQYMDRTMRVIQEYPERAIMIDKSIPRMKQPKQPLVRKLSSFSDKEGKTRTVGMFDYWSQTCLKPIHDMLCRILRGIPQDCTYNQNAFTEFLLHNKQSVYHSLDLTNATDRMPIALQALILEPLIGKERTQAWKGILTDLPFHVKGDAEIYYKTGQPMGAYSSWPIMALTHHFIVKLAGKRAGISNFVNYCILGDDIVIADTEVSREYRTILQTLDMPISEPKTHSSEFFFEFAKRYFYHGKEISPFNISSLSTVYKRYYLLHNFMRNQLMKGWSITYEKTPHFIYHLYKILDRNSHGKRASKLYMIFDLVTEFKENGNITAETLGRTVKYLPKITLCSSDPLVQANLIGEILLDLKRSQIRNEMSSCRLEMDRLGDSITRLIMKLVPEEQWTLPDELTYWHPFGFLMVEHTSKAIEDFVYEYDPDLECVKLMHVRGVLGRMMKKDLLVYKDSRSLELLADARLVKQLIRYDPAEVLSTVLEEIDQMTYFSKGVNLTNPENSEHGFSYDGIDKQVG
uniref:RNA-dependent RNA polymerase n=1 Tax=araluen mito-like virus TaxID=2858880 RepID=A0A8F5XQ73_9VIRU|nr:RNA-dependent RNA polymerase [araluen mito-like virus]